MREEIRGKNNLKISDLGFKNLNPNTLRKQNGTITTLKIEGR